MQVTDLELQMADGVADAVWTHPSPEMPRPAVLYLTDIGGIRPAQRASAARLAARGYAVLMPNVFYRTARPPLWDGPRDMKDEKTRAR